VSTTGADCGSIQKPPVKQTLSISDCRCHLSQGSRRWSSTFQGLLIAIGISKDGHREVIGFKLADSESESSWGDFLTELKDRGLVSVDLVTSDDHKGLVKAIRKHFQYCNKSFICLRISTINSLTRFFYSML